MMWRSSLPGRCIAIALLLFSAITVYAQHGTDGGTEVVGDDEISRWLNSYATDSSTVRVKSIVATLLLDTANRRERVAAMSADTTVCDSMMTALCDTTGLPETVAETDTATVTEAQQTAAAATDSIGKKSTYTRKRPKSYLDRIKAPTAKELIAAMDTIGIRRKAILESSTNPLFMDWVLFYPDRERVSAFDGEDSMTLALRAEARADVRKSNPELYRFHSSSLPEFTDISIRRINSHNPDKLKLKVESDFDRSTIDIDKPSDPFWKHGAQFQLQATQNYISANWYNGGSSTLNGIANITAFLNYNNNKNVQWDNRLEWRLGLNGAGSDTLRKVRVNEDFLKISSKMGVKAFQNFYYTAEAEFSTPFFNMFNENSYERTASTFSPIRLYLSLGLDYKYKEKLSVFVSPLSYKFVYVMDTTVHDGVDPANSIARKVGIKPGQNDLNQLGGLIRVGYKHKFSNLIDIETKFSFYANYVGDIKGVELDWEIIGNFMINRFLSAKVTLHPRYDNTIETTDGSKPKIQFYEMISFGFNYKL